MMADNDDPSGHSDAGFSDWTRRLRKEPQSVVEYVDAIDANALDGEVGFAAEHVRRYIASGGRDDGWEGPRPILILYTMGRKSGRFRRNPLLFFEQGGARYVIGSKGGDARHPAWFLNLLDTPRVHVRVMADVYEADAQIVSAADRAALWPQLVLRYPMFVDYQAATAREIPLVRLVPVTR
jgi:deazaflavin-dependent oxidoreductase (nitroreductase family)